MDKSKNLGIKLFGGNKVGIYVHDVAPGSPSDHAGIRKGDLILEYNGVDLSGVTAEQAANEISKLTDTVTMLVQNKLQSEWYFYHFLNSTLMYSNLSLKPSSKLRISLGIRSMYAWGLIASENLTRTICVLPRTRFSM